MSIATPPPPLGSDWKPWGERINAFLTSTRNKLQFRDSDSRAVEDGILMWDAQSTFLIPNFNKARNYLVGNLVLVAASSLDIAPYTQVMCLQSLTFTPAISPLNIMLFSMTHSAQCPLWQPMMSPQISGQPSTLAPTFTKNMFTEFTLTKNHPSDLIENL